MCVQCCGPDHLGSTGKGDCPLDTTASHSSSPLTSTSPSSFSPPSPPASPSSFNFISSTTWDGKSTPGILIVTCSESGAPLKKWTSQDSCTLHVVGSNMINAFFLVASPRRTRVADQRENLSGCFSAMAKVALQLKVHMVET